MTKKFHKNKSKKSYFLRASHKKVATGPILKAENEAFGSFI